MSNRLQDKEALVTGVSRGLGAGIARRLASEGADMALTYVSKSDQAKATAEAARARCQVGCDSRAQRHGRRDRALVAYLPRPEAGFVTGASLHLHGTIRD